MNELYRLFDDLNVVKCRMKIRGESIDPEIKKLDDEVYASLVAQIEDKGRNFFGDSSLSYENIEDSSLTYLSNKAKEFINADTDDVIERIASLDEDEGTAIIKLESILVTKQNDVDTFEGDPLFSVDRKYLSKFSDADIARFNLISSLLSEGMGSSKTDTNSK